MKFSKSILSLLLVLCITIFSVLPIAAAEVPNESYHSNVIALEEANIVEDGADITSIIGDIEGDVCEISIEIEDSESSASPYALHVPNKLVAALTPGQLGFAITLQNIGLDRISYVQFTVDIYTYGGAYVTSFTISDTNVKVGTTTYTYLIDKAETVQETVYFRGYAEDGEIYDFGTTSTVRYNFVGGAYGTMAAYEGQRHHIPSNSVTSISTYSGPAIRMLTEDHRLTASYGSSTSAINFRAQEAALIAEGNFAGAMQLGIDNIRSLFGTKYNNAIAEMIAYAVASGYISAGSVS